MALEMVCVCVCVGGRMQPADSLPFTLHSTQTHTLSHGQQWSIKVPVMGKHTSVVWLRSLTQPAVASKLHDSPQMQKIDRLKMEMHVFLKKKCMCDEIKIIIIMTVLSDIPPFFAFTLPPCCLHAAHSCFFHPPTFSQTYC